MLNEKDIDDIKEIAGTLICSDHINYVQSSDWLIAYVKVSKPVAMALNIEFVQACINARKLYLFDKNPYYFRFQASLFQKVG